MSTHDANAAKLEVAADHGLRAKFTYQGEDDTEPRKRRLEVESLYHDHQDNLLVTGESYDEDDEAEGHRQFRLDRIVGPVVIR